MSHRLRLRQFVLAVAFFCALAMNWPVVDCRTCGDSCLMTVAIEDEWGRYLAEAEMECLDCSRRGLLPRPRTPDLMAVTRSVVPDRGRWAFTRCRMGLLDRVRNWQFVEADYTVGIRTGRER